MSNLERVQNFIQEYWNIKNKSRLGLDTTLSDLGFYGDDKSEFIYSFFSHFEVNPDNFDFNKYIESESNFLSPMSIIKLIFNNNKNPVKEITIKNLISAIENKKWMD